MVSESSLDDTHISIVLDFAVNNEAAAMWAVV